VYDTAVSNSAYSNNEREKLTCVLCCLCTGTCMHKAEVYGRNGKSVTMSLFR